MGGEPLVGLRQEFLVPSKSVSFVCKYKYVCVCFVFELSWLTNKKGEEGGCSVIIERLHHDDA